MSALRWVASPLLLLPLALGCDAAPLEPDAGLPADAETLSDAEALADAGSADAASPSAYRARYDLDAVHPEGGTFDVASERFFVGSLGDGSVHAIDARTGEQAVVFRETEPGTWWTLGMDVDEARHRLVICAMDDRREIGDVDPPYEGWVWELDLTTGECLARHRLGDAFDTATCTDVTVARDGTIYVCDREHPNLYVIEPGGAPALLATDDLLSGSLAGQNALVLLPDESALLSVVYLRSRLARVSLPDGAVTEVDIDGDFFDGTPALSGADGMTWSGDALLVQFTSQLVRLTPTLGDWSAARSVSVDVPAQMTDVVHTPEGDYLLNGQAVQFALGRDPAPFALVRFEGS